MRRALVVGVMSLLLGSCDKRCLRIKGANQGGSCSPSLGKVRTDVDKPVTLPDGSRFTLVGHGHKRGETSPLIIRARFAPPGKDEADSDAYVELDEVRTFAIAEGYWFELGEYRYDQYMELTYYGWVPPQKY